MSMVFCLIAILLGLWISFLNWYCFYLTFIKKEKSPSWIPFLAGIFLFIGLYFLPGYPTRKIAWVSFLIDWGSIPGVGHTIFYHIKRIWLQSIFTRRRLKAKQKGGALADAAGDEQKK